jgi:hypothetical protein
MIALCVDAIGGPPSARTPSPRTRPTVATEGDVDEAITADEALGREVLEAMGFAVVGAAGYEAGRDRDAAARCTGRCAIIVGRPRLLRARARPAGRRALPGEG